MASCKRTRFGKLRIDKHIAALTKLFTTSEEHKVDYFRDSLFGHPTSILAEILKQFDFEFRIVPSLPTRRRTWSFICRTWRLPSKHRHECGQTSSRPTHTLPFNWKPKQLRDDVQALMRKRSSDNANPNNKKQKQKQNKNRTKNQTPARERPARTGDEPTEGLDYCHNHNHGYQHSHPSYSCKVLCSDKKKY